MLFSASLTHCIIFLKYVSQLISWRPKSMVFIVSSISCGNMIYFIRFCNKLSILDVKVQAFAGGSNVPNLYRNCVMKKHHPITPFRHGVLFIMQINNVARYCWLLTLSRVLLSALIRRLIVNIYTHVYIKAKWYNSHGYVFVWVYVCADIHMTYNMTSMDNDQKWGLWVWEI